MGTEMPGAKGLTAETRLMVSGSSGLGYGRICRILSPVGWRAITRICTVCFAMAPRRGVFYFLFCKKIRGGISA